MQSKASRSGRRMDIHSVHVRHLVAAVAAGDTEGVRACFAGAAEDTGDAELLKLVEQAREEHPGFVVKLERYRRDRERYQGSRADHEKPTNPPAA